jgi:hypothetical protein
VVAWTEKFAYGESLSGGHTHPSIHPYVHPSTTVIHLQSHHKHNNQSKIIYPQSSIIHPQSPIHNHPSTVIHLFHFTIYPIYPVSQSTHPSISIHSHPSIPLHNLPHLSHFTIHPPTHPSRGHSQSHGLSPSIIRNSHSITGDQPRSTLIP